MKTLLDLDPSTPLTHVIFHQGDDYNIAVGKIEAAGGSIDDAAEYLAQWDDGDETDMASQTYSHSTTLGSIRRLRHEVYPARAGGLDYLVMLDRHLGFYSLYRLPLNQL